MEDKIRNVNILICVVGIVLVYFNAKPIWRDINWGRRLRYISLVMFALSAAYGTMELLYWPSVLLRPWVLLVAALTMVASGIAENRSKGPHS